ncbi:hypothetical protein PS850_03511 [Pseudomonas fluorescens]|nr:hypothetical protein PS850_03511 [Pseudomonas fluorescens]
MWLEVIKYPGIIRYEGAVTVKVFYFPISKQYIDVDNGLKHTIDGFAPHIRKNDKTLARIITERFAPIPSASLVVPIGLASEIASLRFLSSIREMTTLGISSSLIY